MDARCFWLRLIVSFMFDAECVGKKFVARARKESDSRNRHSAYRHSDTVKLKVVVAHNLLSP